MTVTALIDALLAKTTAAILAERCFPESTYRLQFHAGFRFQDAARIIPYLHELGITDCYASPYLKARPGSKHGYDILDHRVLNPEIGTEEDYEVWVGALRERGMGQVLDVVPNHMGIVGNENPWWNDILENGPSSPYSGYFDIAWYPPKPALREKVLLPVLGEPYGKVLESQQLRLQYESGTFTVHYFTHRFPVAPRSYHRVLGHRVDELKQVLGAESPEFMEYQSILTAISYLPPRSETDPQKVADCFREKEVIKRRLTGLIESCQPVRDFVEQNVVIFNGTPDAPRSFDLLDDLLNDQAYRLSSWRVASDEINYRRFFDINELAALSLEKHEVFAATHNLILRLLAERKVTGVRIDHPDGLYDPRQYLERLQEHFVLERARTLCQSDPEFQGVDWQEMEGPLVEAIRKARQSAGSALQRALYVVVEKILGKGEPLPEDWPVYGATGYHFLNMLNGLFVDPSHAAAFTRMYDRWIGSKTSFSDVVYQKKFLILQVSLSSELHVLAHQLDRLSEKNRWTRDFTLNSLRHSLREIIACFPVYRSYITEAGVHKRDRFYVETAVARAKQKNPAISASLFDFVRDMLLLRCPDSATEGDRAEQCRFAGKFQQVTGPVMAKGLEDTAFYVYNRLLSLNEVGGDPERFGVLPAAFHRYNQERQAQRPYALSATATHDTKRGEDVRARLNVLSELPKEWQRCVSRWHRLNRRHRPQIEDMPAPDRNDEYLFYQTLIGTWPFENKVQGSQQAGVTAEYVERIQAYMQKATREAKVHTSWINPNPAYEDAVRHFIVRVLDEQGNRRFLQHFREFQRRVSHYGVFNSLSQILLKIASPGVPDIYQGTELWDLSLVDPDNRREVDYDLRLRTLQELKQRITGEELSKLALDLLQHREDGQIKLYLLYGGLNCRRSHPGLFSRGDYVPCEAEGSKREHVVAFIRKSQEQWGVAVVPRLVVRLLPNPESVPLGSEVWQDTTLLLPGLDPGRRCRNVFTAETLVTAGVPGLATLHMAEVLAHFPVALLLGEQ